ncbi:hypothetical protein WJX74_010460 [Apatococcus lobatus]|uniref:Uncharacterized protein n=1 Tax=Apatococcus lobatus TaxID=904363 RepID=A0AAW1RTG3_9CHLO
MLRAGVGQQLTSDHGWVAGHQNSQLRCRHRQVSQRQQRSGRGCRRQAGGTCITADYVATSHDSQVLQKPIKQALQSKEVRNVFGFDRDMRQAYNIGKVLGAGSFGVVRTVTHKGNKRKYACKTIPKVPKRGDCTPRYLLKIQQEVDAMEQLGVSLDAVYLKDVYEDDENVHLVMELCLGGGILDQYNCGGASYTEKRIASIIRSVLRFVAQCHAKGFIYRDIKPDNFLLLTADPTSPIRATDFGLSIRHWPGEEPLKSRSGTPVFMAPEVIMQDYSHEADVWSVGILMYHMLTGRFPFWDSVSNLSLQQVWQAILVRQVDLDSPQAKQQLSEGARDLLSGLLRRNPADRLTAGDALAHAWVQEGGIAEDTPLNGSVVQRLQRYGTYGHLKQMVLKMIMEDVVQQGTAVAETVAHIRELFERLDTDKSGGIDMKEFTDGLKQQGYTLSSEEIEQIMDRIDINADKLIVFDELAASLLDWKALQQDRLWTHWVDLAFNKFDANGDGFLSLEEILQHLPAELAGASTQDRILEARRMLREADANGDGRISKEEFIALLQEASMRDSLDQYDSRYSGARAEQTIGE